METRLGPVPVMVLGVFVLTGCVSLEPSSQPPEGTENGGQETGGNGQSEESEPPEIDPVELTYDQLDAEQIEYLLLDEDDWPYSLDSFEEEEDEYLSEWFAEWADYFRPLDGIDYSREEEDCFDGIAEMDRIESDGRENLFVGGLRDNPNTSFEEDVIMLGISSFRDEQDTASVWEDIHAVCDDVEIEEDGDRITVQVIEHNEWSGLHFTVEAGSFFDQDMFYDDLLMATKDHGENTLYAVGFDVSGGTFTDTLSAQLRKLEEGLPEDLLDGDAEDEDEDDEGLEDDDDV